MRAVGDPAARSSGPLSRPLETYEQLGFLAGPAQFPAVAGFSTMAGPGDSTWVLLGVSMPSSALRFQRSGTGFEAQYQVVATFLRGDEVVKRFERDETVHVPTFAETGRTDESIVFQHAIALPAGHYDVTLHASDANSSRGFRVRDTLDVPRYGANNVRFPQPLVVYDAHGRSSREATPNLILNPRHTVAYGSDGPRVYLEAYGVEDALPIVVTVVDEAGTAVWSDPAVIRAGGGGVRHAVVDLPASLPLGKLWVEVEPRDAEAGPRLRSPLVVSISDQWVVANFDDVLELAAYIATPEELDSLRAGSPNERRERWDAFWMRREPLAATPGNEFRDEFFRRVRYATEQFSQAGTPGWETDRGEVFIVLGAPTSTEERQPVDRGVAGRPNAIEWTYDSAAGGGLELLFVDRSRFGGYELTPSSRAAFRTASERLKPRVGR